MPKKAYYGQNVITEFCCAIDLLVEAYEYCTPTDVLRFVGVEENEITRRVVIDIADMKNYTVQSSGRGYRIWKVPF